MGPFKWLLIGALCAGAAGQSTSDDDDASKLVRSLRHGRTSPTNSVVASKGGIRPPLLSVSRQAEYSDEANIAGVTARVTVVVSVKTDGTVQPTEVQTPVGFGLEQKALEAAQEFRFLPGGYQGTPVEASAAVEVGFPARPGAPRSRRMEFDLPPGSVRPVLEQGEELPRISGIEGALIKLHISEVGRVTDVDALVLKNIGTVPNALKADSPEVQAFERLRNWRFSPAVVAGMQFEANATLELDYRTAP